MYPGRHNCPNVGFTYTLNTHTLTNGPHTVRLVAYDDDNPPKWVEVIRNVSVNNSGSPPVAISPTSAYVATHPQTPESQQFTAFLYGQVSSAVNWSRAAIWPYTYWNPGTITSNGLYTAPKPEFFWPGDQVAVTATSQADPSQSATAVVTLVGSLSPPNAWLGPSMSHQFFTTMGNVTWEVSPPGMGTVDSWGIYTSPPGGYPNGTIVKVIAKKTSNPTHRQQGVVWLGY